MDFGWSTLPSGAPYQSLFHRVDDDGNKQIYLLTSLGRGAGLWGGERSVRMFFTTPNYSSFAQAAVALSGGTTELVSDPTSTVDGNDTPPPGWASCGPTAPALPGIASDVVQTQGVGTILGDPPILLDPTIDASTFTEFGGVTYADMAAMATKVYTGLPSYQPYPSPSVIGVTSNTADPNNWGDPLNPSAPCGDYFPIVHIQGAVEFNGIGSVGQGILLVDGNMSVGGGDFTWVGLVMVQGACVYEYNSSVHGAVLCASGGGEIGDAAPLKYSTCGLEAAMAGSGVFARSLQPIGSRAWGEVLR